MYSTCLFCHSTLGTNEIVEHFPVGRRLAFDAAKGRLWVVCRKCERWNLTPLEERWEAIEECERVFRAARRRVSTENIGLARLSEGLELVRIGNPLRPELAAWRYGDQFGRRRRKQFLYAGAGMAVAGAYIVAPVAGLIGAFGSVLLGNVYSYAVETYASRRVRVRLTLPGDDDPALVRRDQLKRAALVSTGAEWALRVSFQRPPGTLYRLEGGSKRALQLSADQEFQQEFRGMDAIRVAGKLLPAINAEGASARTVRSAAELLGETPDADRLFGRFAAARAERNVHHFAEEPRHALLRLPREARVALEMAAHEEQERRALEGELALLEAAWREAEEIARITDDMFLPRDASSRLDRLKHDA
jgi:hypothetical protein